MSSTTLAVTAATKHQSTKTNNSPKAPGASFCCNGQKCDKCVRRNKYIRSQKLKNQVGLMSLPNGPAILATLRTVAAVRGINLPRQTINLVEGLVALYFSLRECQSQTQFLSTVVLYLRGQTNESVLLSLSQYLESMVGLRPQSGSDDPKWLEEMRNLQHNWSRAISGEGFSLISRVISLCLALGMCNVSQYQFTLGGIRLFSIDAFKKHCTAVDLADACFATVTYFVEGGYQCFLQGSVKPLLFGGFNMENFEDNHSKCYEWFELTRAGNLQRIAGVGENDFEKLLCDTIETARDLVRTSQSPVEKNILSRKMEGLLSLRANFRQTRVQGGIKVAPYCIGLFGGSGVGKSFLTQVLMTLTLKTNGHSADPERIVTLNDSDKFMSNYRSYVNGIIIDDLGNTNAQYVEKAPTAKIIEIVNNVRSYANMAEADMKGKVSIEPYVTIITKNVKDSCANQYSNEPASITRRENITVTVSVRKQFASKNMLDSEKVARAFPQGPPLVPDLWTFKVEQSYPVPNKVKGKAATIGWEVIHWRGRAMKDVSIHDLLEFVTHDSRMHFKNQEKLVENTNSLHDKLTVCQHCTMPTVVCQCIEEDDDSTLDVQAGISDILSCLNPVAIANSMEATNEAITPKPGFVFWKEVWDLVAYGRKREKNPIKKCWNYFFSYNEWYEPRCYPLEFLRELEMAATTKIMEDLRKLEDNFWCTWLAFIPQYMLTNRSCAYILEVLTYSRLEEQRKEYTRQVWRYFILKMLACLLMFFYIPTIGKLYFLYSVYVLLRDIAVRDVCTKAALYREIASRRDALPHALQGYRDNHSQVVISSCAALAGIYLLAQGWKALRCIPVTQGNLQPKTVEDIKERDAEVNPWSGVVVSPMPVSEASKTSIFNDVKGAVSKNLCYISIDREDKRSFCNAFFPCSNVALIPAHIWNDEQTLKAKFIRHDPESIGGNFSALLSRETSVFIPDTDLCLTWVPSGGDWPNLTKFFPLGQIASCPATLVYKDELANLLEMKMIMIPGTVRSEAGNYEGANYSLSQTTFEGLCMAVCITDSRGPCIGGFHLAGVDHTTRGASGLLTQQQLTDSLSSLKKISSVLLSSNSGTIRKEQYGVKYFIDTDVHKKSPINFLPPGSNVKFYGQVTGRATYSSDVVQTPISPIVAKHCGVENKWGKPSFNKGYPWQASLQYSANPSIGLPGHLLNRAKEDFIQGIIEHLDSIPGLKEEVRPLTRMEVVCGKDGVRFVDKMPPNTSVGYPLGGPKRDHLNYLDPEDHPDFACPAELHSQFWDEAMAMEELYLKGERAYPIYKACLKDEPTPLNKTKVRVFQGAPIAFQLLVRRYFLPIMRIQSLFPLISECAVGINAQGPEWQALCDHITKFGEDRVLAGDYGKYDLRMPAQITFVSIRGFIDIARHCNYPDRAIRIMEGLASDIAYPLTAYNGDLLQLMGSSPSGINMTVYLNSNDNSLLLRSFYYHVYPNAKHTFREVCAMVTYGDDFKGSVAEQYPLLNHIAYSQFLDEHGIVLTMPDKESTPTEYMNDADADFLKRSNVYIPEIGMKLGALDEDSIFKSLHTVLKSKAVTTTQQSMSNIDGALREWFAHGRDVYEKRRDEMRAVANEADIAYGCNMLTQTYDDCIDVFCEKYNITRQEPESL